MDHALGQRIRDGDPEAFGQLFDDHAQIVYRHALRVSGDRSVAEDVVSLTYLEAWRLRRRVRPDSDNLLPWLLAIATNVQRNVARAARRHRAALDRLPERGTIPDFAHELVDQLVDNEQLRAVRAVLPRLRRTDREVFTLCVWSGLDYATTAEVLGIPVGTVRSRLSRARARLRELVAQELKRTRPTVEPGTGRGHLLAGRTNTARSI